MEHHRAYVFETAVAEQLKLLTPDTRPGSHPYVQHHRYTPDFKVGDVYIEAKGGSGPHGFPSNRRTAMCLARAQNQELKDLIIVLKYPNSKCTGKMTQAQWCEKKQFHWCTLPNLKDKIKEVQNARENES